MTSPRLIAAAAALALLAGCTPPPAQTAAPAPAAGSAQTDIGQRLAKYTTVRLTADVSRLTANEPLHRHPPRRRGAAHGGPLPRGLPGAAAARRRQAARGRRPGGGPRPQALPGAPRRRAALRRLPGERPGLDGHEEQHARRGD